MEATFKKIDSNLWMCEDIEDHPTLMRLAIGKVISVAARLIRSVAYHRRFFKMLDFAYDWWEAPALEYRGQPVYKNKERFRKDVMILAGYGDPVVNIKGEVRMEARSMSFAKMDQDEFEMLYSKCFDVCLDKVLGRNREADLARAIEDFMRFA